MGLDDVYTVYAPYSSQLDFGFSNLKCPENRISEELKLNVVGGCSHQFKKDNIPYGAALIYLLAGSHLSIHTKVK